MGEIVGALRGPHVHVKPDGVTIRRFLKGVAREVWFRGIPNWWRSIVEENYPPLARGVGVKAKNRASK